MPKSKSAVVCLSGGIDSTTCASVAAEQHGPENVHAISFQYGQKHDREIVAAETIARELKLSGFHVVQLPTVWFQSKSAILQGTEVPMPHQTYKELAETEGVSPTYVPFRNANFLSQATAYALIHELDEVWIGVHAEDARGFAYPDCTFEFTGAMANAIWVGTYMKVRLIAPLQWMMKKDIVKLGLQLRAPFELTTSCYEGNELACGTCPTCVERLEAFRENSVRDPARYAIQLNWDRCRAYDEIRLGWRPSSRALL